MIANDFLYNYLKYTVTNMDRTGHVSADSTIFVRMQDALEKKGMSKVHIASHSCFIACMLVINECCVAAAQALEVEASCLSQALLCCFLFSCSEEGVDRALAAHKKFFDVKNYLADEKPLARAPL